MKVDRDATLAVVGASARAAAFSLLRAGYRIVTADLFADADLARQCRAHRITPYPEGFADWLPKANCNAWLYTGALENHPALIDRLSVFRQLYGHSGDTLRRARDPLLLQSVLQRAGLHFPTTERAKKSPQRKNWLGKTYRGSCGSGVSSMAGTGFVQQRLDGMPLSAVYIGSQLVGVTRQFVGEPWTGASEFQYCGSIAPWPLKPATRQQLERLGSSLHDEFELTDLYGVDFMLVGDVAWTLEVNPRYTAAVEVVEQASGLDVFRCASENAAALLSTATQQLTPNTKGSSLKRVDACGKVILYAKAPLAITERLSQSLLQRAGDLPWPQMADIPVAGTVISVGQPILTLFATGASCENVNVQLRRRVADIEQEIYRETEACG